MTDEKSDPLADLPPPVLMLAPGDVSYVCSFPGAFLLHTEETARATAERLRNIGAMGVYRIELVALFEKRVDAPTEPTEPA